MPTAAVAPAPVATATVRVSNIPPSAVAAELLAFFDSAVAAAGAAFACEIAAAHRGWLSRGHGTVQFDSTAAAALAADLASSGRLPRFLGSLLSVSPAPVDLLPRAPDLSLHAAGARLVVGNRVAERELEAADGWDGVRAEVIPGKRRVDLYLEHDSQRYKLEVLFEDIWECFGCSIDGMAAILLQLTYAPRIHTAISGPAVNSRFTDDRFHACKEDAKFAWVRALDFTPNHCFGKCSNLVLKLDEGAPVSHLLQSLPFSGELGELYISSMDVVGPSSKVVPLVDCPSGCSVPYEVLFRLNSLVHMGKLVAKHVNTDLFKALEELPVDISRRIFEKMSKLKSTCYKPLQFIQQEAYSKKISHNALLSNKSEGEGKLMRCYRVHITPLKIYCLGPEEEVSNYVVKYHSAYASDFVRVTFVDEDWSKLPPNAISARIEQGFFSQPFKTGLYDRIISILKEGFSIGPKKFEFLAFSASQLRGNSVWMFASNDSLSAEGIRRWMGHFEDIRSVSKCAARMGQLFSSSRQTFEVEPNTEVKVIPDIEVTTDGTKYIFSDGIGKMSLRFAKKVAHKIGLDYNNPPSAFQIRYGGYKGVIAVDPTSFRNLSLRPSMKKFESESTMLNITSWSKSQPCYVNREIISLLSTLGIRDEIFESMQQDDMRESDEMLTNREVALSALGKIGGAEIKTALKMLLQGYEPSSEPYLLMVLKAHQENRLSDIRTRCKIHVPKGRVLLGCLDETGKLEYGQVYIRITKNSKEHKDDDQPYFYDDNGETAVVVGKIAISKNPCLLPGDIRVLEAVYDPTMNLVDCVVFPQKGERPHPNECPGGDLDGDLYFITWEDKLIPEKVDTPMDYTATRPRIMDHVVTLEEIQKYFADYMLNDALGVISTAHLIHADRQPLKARSPECLQLAALHSMAVDFAKTGAPAEMPWSLRPREFPDFMGRWDKPMYISNGVLGKFYRAAVSHMESSEALASLVQSSPRYDPDLEVPGFEEFLEAAEEYYHLYAEKLKNDQEHLFRNMPRNEYHNLFNFIIGKYLKILNLEMGRKDMDFVQLLVTLQNSRFISRWIWSGRGKNWCVAERLGKIYPGGIDRFKKVQTLEPFSMYSGLGAKNAPVVVRTGKSPLAPLTLLQNSHFGPSQNHQIPGHVGTQVGSGQSTWQPPDWLIEPRPGVYYLDVLKDGKVIDRINLDMKRHIFGRQVPACDFVLDHQSVSRQHAVIIPHKNGSIYVMDLGSDHGTFVANERLTKDNPVELEIGQSLCLAASIRTYILRKNFSKLPMESFLGNTMLYVYCLDFSCGHSHGPRVNISRMAIACIILGFILLFCVMLLSIYKTNQPQPLVNGSICRLMKLLGRTPIYQRNFSRVLFSDH